MRTTLTSFFLAASAFASQGAAQTAVHVEAGGARVAYGDTSSTTSGTVSAGMTALTPSTTFSALVAGSMGEQSSQTLFGTAQGSVFAPVLGWIRAEAHASGSGTTYGSGSSSTHLLGGARLHTMIRGVGAWVGMSAGRVVDPVGARGLRVAELGAWTEARTLVAQVVASPVRIAGGIDYTDVEATVQSIRGRWEIGGVAGLRSNIRGHEHFPNAWASASATMWLRRSVGVSAAVGSYPADIGQGLPAARYVSLGVRWSPRRILSPLTPLPSLASAQPVSPRTPGMTVRDAGNGNRTIEIAVAAAQDVELMGDFTDWTPARMTTRDSRTWSVTLPVRSGVHQVNVRIDGGAWTVPDGLTTISDEFGGSVGILVVP